MMKRVLYSLLLCMATVMAHAQTDEGIKFFDGTYEEALVKAKAENKLLFLDCYADWCGPCFKMAKEIFTLKEVGEYFNAHFISLKCNMEKNEAGKALRKRFDVQSYPTLLFVSPEGFVTGRRRGFTGTDSLLAFARKALDNGTQSDEKRFATGERDEAFLKKYIQSFHDGHQADAVEGILNTLYAERGISLLNDKDYWFAFDGCAADRQSALTQDFIKNYDAMCKVHGRYAVDQKVRNLFASFPVVLTLYDTENYHEYLNKDRKQAYLNELKQSNLPGWQQLQQEVEYLVMLKEKDYAGAYKWGEKCLKKADARVLCNWAAWGERMVKNNKDLRNRIIAWADRAIAAANGNTEIITECNNVKRDLAGSPNPVISFKGKNRRTTIPMRGY